MHGMAGPPHFMLYLFHGPDEFARSEAIHALRARIPPDLADLNITNLEGRRLKIDTLAAACEAMPFLADRRMVIVADALKHTKAGKERDELRTYLERVPAICDVLFVEQEDVDRRSTLYTYLKKVGEVVECPHREGAELVRWLNERAKLLAARLEPAAAQRLIDLAGNDGRTLINELAKLATYVGRNGRIAVREVDLLIQDTSEQNLFSFLDDLSMRRRTAALRGLRALLEEGQAPTYLLFMLARQVRIMIGVQELVAQRVRPDDIAARLGQKPFVVRKTLDQVRAFKAGELERIHDRLIELDQATKTGKIQAEVGLEVLVLEIVGG